MRELANGGPDHGSVHARQGAALDGAAAVHGHIRGRIGGHEVVLVRIRVDALLASRRPSAPCQPMRSTQFASALASSRRARTRREFAAPRVNPSAWPAASMSFSAK